MALEDKNVWSWLRICNNIMMMMTVVDGCVASNGKRQMQILRVEDITMWICDVAHLYCPWYVSFMSVYYIKSNLVHYLFNTSAHLLFWTSELVRDDVLLWGSWFDSQSYDVALMGVASKYLLSWICLIYVLLIYKEQSVHSLLNKLFSTPNFRIGLMDGNL